jgi:putative DNA methylase
MTDRRFIEESFPVKEVGEISAKEKNIRHGHISTLHLWWARRPLAASRATAYAALVPPPKDIEEWQKQRDFIIELSKWENSNNQILLEKARRDILQAHAARLSEEYGVMVTVEDIDSGKYPHPRVIDPFAGGGSYPLEAMRLGCETYASDYNPVAVLIEKATLEYPQKFGKLFEGMPKWAKPKETGDEEKGGKSKGRQQILFDTSSTEISETFNPLLEAVHYWGNWVLEEACKDLAEFYPPDSDGSIPIGYIWARTIPCQNPACGQEIPLMRQFWLSKKDKKKVSLYPDISTGKIIFHIVGDGYDAWPDDFDPDNGTVNRAVATCPLCGSVIDASTTRCLFREGHTSQRMISVVLQPTHHQGKTYRIATGSDYFIYQLAASALQVKRESLKNEWGFDPIPDEEIPIVHTITQRPFAPRENYGFMTWGSLSNARQELTLITYANKIRLVTKQAVESGLEQDLAIAVTVYLALALDRFVDQMTTFVRWIIQLEAVASTFSRQALSMVWDYIEVSLFSDGGSYASALDWVSYVISHLSKITTSNKPVISQSTATQLNYHDAYFDIVLTDPPYYDNVPYSYLSDFFYVWLKRTIGHLYPDLFSTPLTPKASEIVAYSRIEGGIETGKHYFEGNLKRALLEIWRILKSNGMAVIVYAHKSTASWETLINALLDSDLVITGAWPLDTERQTRVRAMESASLTSSIYILARKIPRQPTGFYNDLRTELRHHLDAKLHRLWEEGISGADFFIAAIGSAIEVFGKYEQVIDYEGNVVRADRLLEEVRTVATDYAVHQILHDGFASEISDMARLYVLWRWNYGEMLVPFDEGRKMAQSCGVDLTQEWGKGGFVKKEKEFIRLLGPHQRKLDDLDDPRNMIDVLHKALLLWEKGKHSEMIMDLADHDYGRSEAFYRVAQAVSETLPIESKEKKLLDGFLAGRERVQEEVQKAAKQARLFD